MFHWGDGLGGMWFVIIIVIIVFGYNLIKSNQQRDYENMPRPETALDILKKRYAKGEITKEQFEEMKKDVL